MTSFYDGSVDVKRKVRLHDDLVMEMLFEVLSTLVASVAIIHGENLKFGPFSLWYFWFFWQWLDNIQDDSNSILVSFSNQPNMCVGRK